MNRLAITVEAEGDTASDIADALREALRLVESGCTSGQDSSDTGQFYFEISEAKD